MNASQKMQGLALCAVMCAAHAAHAASSPTADNMTLSQAAQDVVRTVDKPYQKRLDAAPTAAPFKATAPAPIDVRAAAATAAAAAAAAMAANTTPFELTLGDADIRRAFERWARNYKTVVWALAPDLPIDAATGLIVPHPLDVAAAAQSQNPTLLAAMMKVARSFESSKTPFVIREYDNAIVVRPRAGIRP